MKKLRVLDLFSGVGGFSLGLERTGGFETVAFCEIDEDCRIELSKAWPGVPVHDDVRTMKFVEGMADVVTGGFPCQDISVAGNGAGIVAGEKSSLWRENVRALSVVRPRYGVFENSSRLASGDDGRWFAHVLRDLAALGYNAEWHCIPASYVGAPHERDRIWIVASDARSPVKQHRGGLLLGWGQQLAQQAATPAFNHDRVRELQPQRCIAHVRRWALHCAERYWPEAWDAKLAALRNMDDGVPRRSCGAAALRFGNAVVPQIPEMIGHAILAAEGVA